MFRSMFTCAPTQTTVSNVTHQVRLRTIFLPEVDTLMVTEILRTVEVVALCVLTLLCGASLFIAFCGHRYFKTGQYMYDFIQL